MTDEKIDAAREEIDALREEIREDLAVDLGGEPEDYHADRGREELAPDGGD
jgi:hypothetical protein